MEWEKWNEVSSQLLFVTSRFKVHSKYGQTKSNEIEEKKELLFWVQKERRLRELLNDYKERKKLPESSSKEKNTEKLENELLELNIKVENTKLLLKRLFQNYEAYNNIKDGQKTKFKDLLSERDKRSLKLIELSNLIEEKNGELYSLVEQNLLLQNENKKLTKLALKKSSAPPPSSSSNSKLDKEIEDLKERAEVLSNIHKLIVIESGVNWANDNALYDLMLNLNSFQLDELSQ